MADYRISLSVEGLHEDDGHVRLPALVNELQILSGLLGKIDRQVSGGNTANHFRVVDLSHASPATVGLEIIQNPESPDTREAVVSGFVRALEDIERGEVPVYLGRSMLEDIRNLAKPVGETVASAVLTANGKSFDLTDEIAKRIEHALSGEETCVGTIEGTLEQINLHRGANVFRIYPQVGPNMVACHFGSGLRDLAISALGAEVAVTGLLKYRSGEPFPYAINIDEIEVYPPENELPTIDDLRGLAPDATGDVPSERFIADLRDGWE